MTRVQIVTDSTCNLPEQFWQDYPVTRVPIAVQYAGRSYREGVDLDVDEFYRAVEAGLVPQTSQPAPGDFAEVYRRLANAGPILTITLSARLSGTFQSALLAREEVPEADVHVWDSASISAGLGFQVWEAAEMARAGAGRDRILERLRERREQTAVALSPATLKYLRASGRVGRLQDVLATILDVKPVIVVRQGLLQAGERVRTRQKALRRLINWAVKQVGTDLPVWAAVIHARAQDEAEMLLREIQSSFECERSFVADLCASLAVHGGPGVIGVIVTPARPSETTRTGRSGDGR